MERQRPSETPFPDQAGAGKPDAAPREQRRPVIRSFATPRCSHSGLTEYGGVLAVSAGWRVVVSQKGTRYIVQQQVPFGLWTQRTWAIDRAHLRDGRISKAVRKYGRCFDGEAQPPAFDLSGVPFDPSDVPRLWPVSPLTELAEDFDKWLALDPHPQTLVQDRNARIIGPRPGGSRYRLQRLTPARGWTVKAERAFLADLMGGGMSGGVISSRAPRPEFGSAIRSDELWAFLETSADVWSGSANAQLDRKATKGPEGPRSRSKARFRAARPRHT